jgi:hypothetical protein
MGAGTSRENLIVRTAALFVLFEQIVVRSAMDAAQNFDNSFCDSSSAALRRFRSNRSTHRRLRETERKR